MKLFRLPALAALLTCVIVASCGGGGGGSAGGTVMNPPPPSVTPPPTPGIAVLSGQLGGAGNIDGPGALARFDSAEQVAIDASGQMFIGDASGRIRKISPTGEVSTAANVSGIGGLAFDGAGNLIAASLTAVRKVTPAGEVTLLAGSDEYGYVDGAGAAARFLLLRGITLDTAGNIYAADWGGFTVRKITPDGVVSTFAGKPHGNCDFRSTTPPCYAADGSAAAATFSWIVGIVADGKGNLYVTDGSLRKVSPQGDVSTLVPGLSGTLAMDRDGNVLVSTYDRVLKVTPAGAATTVVGPFSSGPAGFTNPHGLAVDGAGNIIVADDVDVGRISASGAISVIAGKAGGDGLAYAMATASAGVDAAGNLYTVGINEPTVLKVTPSGQRTVLAGAPGQWGYVDGPAATARFMAPSAATVDAGGNVYVVDQYAIRKISSAGVVSTLAGKPDEHGMLDATGTAARFEAIRGMTIDGTGNLYVTDGPTIRRITSQGVVATVAGKADESGGVDGPAGVARLGDMRGIAIDKSGALYVVEPHSAVIRRIGPDGTVSTLAGERGQSGSADGMGAAARFFNPQSITIDEDGNLFVADTQNHTIRKITPAGQVTTVAGQAGTYGVRTGPLPGSLNLPGLVVAAGGHRLYVRSEDAILAIQLP